jgi:hypothetical protein
MGGSSDVERTEYLYECNTGEMSMENYENCSDYIISA